MLEKLVLNNLSLVYLASIIAPFISGDVLNLYLTLSGVLISILLLVTSLYILK